MRTAFTILLACSLPCLGQAQDYRSLMQAPVGAFIMDWDACTTNDGGTFIAGIQTDWVNPGFVGLVRTDGNNDVVMSRQINLSSSLDASSIADIGQYDNGDLFVLLNTYASNNLPSYVVSRLTGAGDLIWSKVLSFDLPFETDYTSSKGRALPNDHLLLNIALYSRMVLVDLDASGALVSSQQFTANLWVSGGDTLWGKNPSLDMAPTDDGGVIISGKREDDGYLVKCDANGNTLWTRIFDMGEYTHLRCIKRVTSGNYVVSGFRGARPFALMIDTDGNILWNRSYHDANGLLTQRAIDVVLEAPNGHLMLATGGDGVPILIHADADGVPLESFSGTHTHQGYVDLFMTPMRFNGEEVRLSGLSYGYMMGTPDRVFDGALSLDSGGDCFFAPLEVSWQQEIAPMLDNTPTFHSSLSVQVTDDMVEIGSMQHTSVDMCQLLTSVTENTGMPEMSVIPSSVPSGASITIQGLSAGTHEVEVIDALGRVTDLGAMQGDGLLSTNGLSPGAYSIHVDGKLTGPRLRFVVE